MEKLEFEVLPQTVRSHLLDYPVGLVKPQLTGQQSTRQIQQGSTYKCINPISEFWWINDIAYNELIEFHGEFLLYTYVKSANGNMGPHNIYFKESYGELLNLKEVCFLFQIHLNFNLSIGCHSIKRGRSLITCMNPGAQKITNIS